MSMEEKYSRESFKGYKIRVIAEVVIGEDKHRLDIYTTQTDIKIVEEHLYQRLVKSVDVFKIVHTATKEQDDAASELVDELFTT